MEFSLDKYQKIRQHFHKYPELSGKEKNTSNTVFEIVNQFKPDNAIRFSNSEALAFIFKGSKEGKTLLFRAELDALPITEENNVAYRSVNKGVAHVCGHDGHLTTLLALAEYLNLNRPKSGRVVLLFQPSEETGEGAKKVIESPEFELIKPDFVFAYHNVPGFKENTII